MDSSERAMTMLMLLPHSRPSVPEFPTPPSAVPAAPDPIPTPPPALRKRRSTADATPAAAGPWTRLPPRDQARTAAADTQLAERVAAAESSGYTMVEVPPDSSPGMATRLYQHLLNRPALQQWIAEQRLEPATLTFHRDHIEGYANHNGVRSAVRFSLTDNSGWNEVSRTLRPIRELLDPSDQGLPFIGSDDALWLPRQGLGQITAGNLEQTWQVISELEERLALADRLEAELEELPDTARTDWSDHETELSPASSLPRHSQAAVERLQRFVTCPQMVRLLEQEGFAWAGAPFRVSEGRLERLSPVGGWVNLTRYVEAVPELNDELEALAALSVPLGNALYSTPRYDMRQLLDFKGLGSARTVSETRNLVAWLRTALPTPPPLGDYGALLPRDWKPGTLTADDQKHMGTMADIRLRGPLARGFSALSGVTLQALQADPQAHLDRLLDSPDALAFGEQMAGALRWQVGQGANSTLPRTLLQQLVTAAIKLHVDPSMSDKPGEVAGYSIYQPTNMGRSFSQVRRDIERHLQHNKGLEPKLAVLAAQVCLAQAAPEMLVRDVPESVSIGTPAWMELRLGCALADHNAPGTSRTMNEQQVTDLTTLEPVSDAQATLMQLNALKVIVDWGVLNGCIRQRSDGEYSSGDIQEAARVFFRQREDVATAFTAASSELPTRKALAIKELLRVLPGITQAEVEGMTVHVASAEDRRNLPISEPRTRSLVETYMTGDLAPGKWVLSDDMPAFPAAAKTPYQHARPPQVTEAARARLDTRIRRLPELDKLLENSVLQHRKKLQDAYATKLKLMFAELPLEDRKLLELGKVELFTLRRETGEIQAKETDALKDASRARHGTLMRVEHGPTVVHFEVFANGKIIKRTDLPDAMELDGVIHREGFPSPHGLVYLPVVRGAQMNLDLDAYANGSHPDPNPAFQAVIVSALGGAFAARELPLSHTPESFVPDTYSSRKTASIVNRIAQDNFYEPTESMLQRASESLPLEKHREARARDHAFLLGFVPFVGAYQEFKQGNISAGLTNLALDVVGVAIGAGSQARALIRSARALVPSRLTQLVTRLKPSAIAVPQVKAGASFSDRAFDFIKQSGLFTSAALNPLDGYPQMINAATKGLVKLPALLAGGAMKWGKTVPHLVTAEEKLRAYLLVAAGQASGAEAPVVTPTAGKAGRYREVDMHATPYNGRWYAIDPRSGAPFGTPLNGFEPTR